MTADELPPALGPLVERIAESLEGIREEIIRLGEVIADTAPSRADHRR